MQWVSPFGDPRITGCLPPSRGFSQAATSFFVFWCQGIHHVHLFYLDHNRNFFILKNLVWSGVIGWTLFLYPFFTLFTNVSFYKLSTYSHSHEYGEWKKVFMLIKTLFYTHIYPYFLKNTLLLILIPLLRRWYYPSLFSLWINKSL